MSVKNKYCKMMQLVTCCLILVIGIFGMQTAIEGKAATSSEIVEMTFGETYSGTASSKGGTTFKFNLPSSGQIQLSITHEYYMDVYLYDYSGSKIYEGDLEAEGKKIIQIDLLAGDYTLCLEGFFFDTNYSFTPTFQAANETISEEVSLKNNEMDYATSLEDMNTKITGQFALNDDKDMYTFTLDKAQKVTFSVFSNVSQMNISVTDAYEDYSYTSGTFSNGTHKFTLAVPAGTYYVTFSYQNTEEEEYGEVVLTPGTYQFTKTTGDFSTTSIKSVKNVSGKKLKVDWNRNSTVSGYQIQIATNTGFTKNKKTITVTDKKVKTKTFTKLKKKTYYVRIRTYMQTQKKTTGTAANEKCYSAWSKTKKIAIKK